MVDSELVVCNALFSHSRTVTYFPQLHHIQKKHSTLVLITWVLLPRVDDKNGDPSFKKPDPNVPLFNYLMQFLTKAFLLSNSLSLSLLDSALGFKL